MSDYYVLWNGGAWLVKEGGFFVDQGGLSEPWGKDWKQVWADGIEHARLIAATSVPKDHPGYGHRPAWA